ncbi:MULTISPECIES: RES domain-containing protein [Elizabethkingia]|uniref:RES domain-containing protein n=1 Tax=Elizabethkingia ursingii TaxID=1756150 RepID=A0AAJ3NCK8_9FLAO|nr:MULTISPECIES: RES domain-containing protein [Elizabethkingia]AQW92886.1 hypothetical protein BBD30_01065 [Elizabethkingia anophelis]AQX09824.1 hypothetical protein BBD34_14805 [Elizabethkingia ursingii]OPB65699.1 hypothetical protein BAS07_15045 [Elizabethkingia anophelis]OPB75967.1 hypothetical protein BAY32_04175 [Elizabethkingia ursingii]OPB84634.1 hypothetical protein BB021_14855 [Elizabethkingia ursingii]
MSKTICSNCVSEDYLHQRILAEGKTRKCSFCSVHAKAFSLPQLSLKVRLALRRYYEKTANEPTDREILMQNEFNKTWERSGERLIDIINDEFGICYEAAQEIEKQIIQSEEANQDYDNNEDFDDDPHYIKKEIGDDKWLGEWDSFKNTLKTQSRFFNQGVEAFLNTVFRDLDSTVTSTDKPIFTSVGPTKDISFLYRARVFQSMDNLLRALKNPDIHLGPTPSNLASDGRMNARGISVFYGATDKDTAIAEVRPPVGSNVITARFNILRELYLLDLRNLKNIVEKTSVFHPQYKEKMEKARFLSKLGHMITQPIMPGDEVLEYLPTQAIADYLASKTDRIIDGIIFPSVQLKGQDTTNIVLFNKSSNVKPYDLPEGTETVVKDYEFHEDGPWKNYTVIDWIPSKRKSKTTKLKKGELQIVIDSIEVHEVNSIHFSTTSYSVGRLKIDAHLLRVNRDN